MTTRMRLAYAIASPSTATPPYNSLPASHTIQCVSIVWVYGCGGGGCEVVVWGGGSDWQGIVWEGC